MSSRPGGVVALAVIFIIIAVLGVIGAIVLEAVTVSQYQASNFANFLQIPLAYLFSAGLPPLYREFIIMMAITSAFSSVGSTMATIGYINIGVLIGLIFIVFYILAAIGLLMMKNWGRILALIVGIFDIIGGIFALFAIVGLIPLIIGIVIVVYLSGDVKYEFE